MTAPLLVLFQSAHVLLAGHHRAGGDKGAVGDHQGDLSALAFWTNHYRPLADPNVVPQPRPEDDGVLSHEVPVAHLQGTVELGALADLRLYLLGVEGGLGIDPYVQDGLEALRLVEIDVPLRELLVDVEEGLLVVLVYALLLDRWQIV